MSTPRLRRRHSVRSYYGLDGKAEPFRPEGGEPLSHGANEMAARHSWVEERGQAHLPYLEVSKQACALCFGPPAPCPLPPAACPLPPAPAACRLPPAACRLPPAACRLPPAACPLPPAPCRLPPAACPLPPAPCPLPPCPLPPCRLPTAACPLPPACCLLSSYHQARDCGHQVFRFNGFGEVQLIARCQSEFAIFASGVAG